MYAQVNISFFLTRFLILMCLNALRFKKGLKLAEKLADLNGCMSKSTYQ
jgi:hypothetical protein